MISDHPLFETAAEAAEAFPITWQRSPDVLSGTYAGRHGMYVLSITSDRPGLLVVRAEIGERPRRDRRIQMGLLCLSATRRFPMGGFHLPAGEGAPVCTFTVVGNTRGPELPDTAIVRNAIRSCLLNAELVAPMVRRGPRQVMVDSGNETPSGPAVTFIDVLDGVVIASAYAFGPDRNVPAGRLPAVSGLPNRMLGDGAPYSLALDLETGAVASHGFLDVSGSATPPGPGLICDLVSRAMDGALGTLSPVLRVAHDGIQPERALAEAVPGLLDRRAS